MPRTIVVTTRMEMDKVDCLYLLLGSARDERVRGDTALVVPGVSFHQKHLYSDLGNHS